MSDLPVEKEASTTPRLGIDQESRDAIKKIHAGFKALQERVDELERPKSTVVEMWESPDQAKLIEALIAVELDMLEDEATFQKTGSCGRGNAAAATLPDLTLYAIPFLAKNGLKIIQEPILFGGRDCLLTTISHASGQKRSTVSALQIDLSKGTALHHAYSAAYTNAKKHAFAAILNLHTGGD